MWPANSTATIRVPRKTRDRLVALAGKRGVSLSLLLTEFAGRTERADALRSEREATLDDLGGSEVRDEERVWDSVLADGLD